MASGAVLFESKLIKSKYFVFNKVRVQLLINTFFKDFKKSAEKRYRSIITFFFGPFLYTGTTCVIFKIFGNVLLMMH